MPAPLRLVLLLVVTLCAGLLQAATPAKAASQPRGVVVFPSNRLTVRHCPERQTTLAAYGSRRTNCRGTQGDR